MTCIVAVKDKGKVYVGADSAGVDGYSLVTTSTPKVFTNGPFIIGYTSSFRMGQLLEHSLDVPKQTKEQTIEKFMNTTFIEAVRRCFKEGGFLKVVEGVESGGTFITGYKGRIFTINDDFQVSETTDKFASVGCGSDLAMGSLHTTKALGTKDPVKRIKMALNAAEAFSAGVRSPFIIKEI